MSVPRALWPLGWSAGVWVALWGNFSAANLIAGLAVGVVALLTVPSRPPTRERGRMTVRPVATLRFLLFFLWALVHASAIVAWEVITPANRIHEGIVALPLRTQSYGVATLIANAISLTPGTLTIEVSRSPLVLYVHVLHLRQVDQVRRELRRLETLALRAFDPAHQEGKVIA